MAYMKVKTRAREMKRHLRQIAAGQIRVGYVKRTAPRRIEKDHR